jgi:valyl-tRNA synthetase
MSKSLKNVVNPDDVIDRYGADSLVYTKCLWVRLMNESPGPKMG